MSDHSKIEWTETTWNPTTGCTKVSPGCDHCYIDRTPPFRMAGRKFLPLGMTTGASTGVQLHHDRLDQPLRWRKSRKVFVNSLSDLFHEDVPDSFIGCVFDIMAKAERHTFQILTKRHARMRALLNKWVGQSDQPDTAMFRAHSGIWAGPVRWPLPNVWLGVSVENQQWADIRIPALLDTPAAVRFLSCEPLLGPVRLSAAWIPIPADAREVTARDLLGAGLPNRVDWVIVGGESGPGARPMHPDWARGLRDQCTAGGVPFFFKQWGEWAPVALGDEGGRPFRIVPEYDHGADGPFTRGWAMRRVGKKAAGRELDDTSGVARTWDEMPAVDR